MLKIISTHFPVRNNRRFTYSHPHAMSMSISINFNVHQFHIRDNSHLSITNPYKLFTFPSLPNTILEHILIITFCAYQQLVWQMLSKDNRMSSSSEYNSDDHATKKIWLVPSYFAVFFDYVLLKFDLKINILH